MESYHLRREDLAVTDQDELDAILRSTTYVTLSMCAGDEPYAVVVNHGYDAENACLYFHCAPEGRKLDVLEENPRVWVVAVEDLGYQAGACDHAYASVMVEGTVEWVEDEDGKRHALEVMIRQLEPEPVPVLERNLTARRIEAVTIGRIRIREMTGKRSLPTEATS